MIDRWKKNEEKNLTSHQGGECAPNAQQQSRDTIADNDFLNTGASPRNKQVGVSETERFLHSNRIYQKKQPTATFQFRQELKPWIYK